MRQSQNVVDIESGLQQSQNVHVKLHRSHTDSEVHTREEVLNRIVDALSRKGSTVEHRRQIVDTEHQDSEVSTLNTDQSVRLNGDADSNSADCEIRAEVTIPVLTVNGGSDCGPLEVVRGGLKDDGSESPSAAQHSRANSAQRRKDFANSVRQAKRIYSKRQDPSAANVESDASGSGCKCYSGCHCSYGSCDSCCDAHLRRRSLDVRSLTSSSKLFVSLRSVDDPDRNGSHSRRKSYSRRCSCDQVDVDSHSVPRLSSRHHRHRHRSHSRTHSRHHSHTCKRSHHRRDHEHRHVRSSHSSSEHSLSAQGSRQISLSVEHPDENMYSRSSSKRSSRHRSHHSSPHSHRSHSHSKSEVHQDCGSRSDIYPCCGEPRHHHRKLRATRSDTSNDSRFSGYSSKHSQVRKTSINSRSDKHQSRISSSRHTQSENIDLSYCERYISELDLPPSQRIRSRSHSQSWHSSINSRPSDLPLLTHSGEDSTLGESLTNIPSILMSSAESLGLRDVPRSQNHSLSEDCPLPSGRYTDVQIGTELESDGESASSISQSQSVSTVGNESLDRNKQGLSQSDRTQQSLFPTDASLRKVSFCEPETTTYDATDEDDTNNNRNLINEMTTEIGETPSEPIIQRVASMSMHPTFDSGTGRSLDSPNIWTPPWTQSKPGSGSGLSTPKSSTPMRGSSPVEMMGSDLWNLSEAGSYMSMTPPSRHYSIHHNDQSLAGKL